MELLLNEFNSIFIIAQIAYLLFAILLFWLLIKIIQFFTLKNRELKRGLKKE